jgi:tetratricopeptide (TPR) repeat protein
MTHHTPRLSANNSDEPFDLSQIFIGREQQLDFFQIYLNRWKQLILNAAHDDTPVTAAPSPNNKIQGLVVLLYGRGGFGKSTLLRKYRDIALKESQNPLLSKTTVNSVIDWEFAVEGKRSLFNPPPGQEVDAHEYFKVLCGHLANALGKQPKEFKEYQAAVKAVEEAKKKANGVLESLKSDDRYGWLRGLAVEAITTAVRTYVPGSKAVLDNPTVKKGIDEAAKLTQEQVSQIHARLHDRLGTKLDDYLDPALRLGLALGRDLAECTKNFPLLLFFDTYEEADEGDRLLRMVMGAAKLRVGWVIASRDNLWAGAELRERSIAMEYGYKEIVPPDRALAVDFNAGGAGAFTPGDIKEYFDLLCQHVHYSPPLPNLTAEEAQRLWDVTKGVPLAVKVAAGLYLDTADVDTITEHVEGKKEIVDQMVRRYLLHARDAQNERAKIYALAMLRRADSPIAVAAALQLEPEQVKTNYASELSRLQRRYSFIFTEKEEPTLHQEVRHFLRLWLLERCKEPHIEAINEHLKEAHETALKKLEERRQYASLKERLQDDEWVGTYLDLTEQQFWIDPVEGVRYVLPFMIAAAIYRRNVNKDVAEIGEFFEENMGSPYRDWWRWADQSLIYTHSRYPSNEELAGLEQLAKLAHQRCPIFPPPVPDCQKELEAALSWKLGEAYQGRDDNRALEWYEKALDRLEHEDELRRDSAQTYWNVAYEFYKQNKHVERMPLLNRAIELAPDYVWAYNSRGIAYRNLKKYKHAIDDYNRAIELDHEYARAYYNRGLAYLWLRDTKQAMADFRHRWTLPPTSISAAWIVIWLEMSKERVELKIAEQLDKLAMADPHHYIAYVCRGLALGLRGNLKDGLAELEQALLLQSQSEPWHVYFWKGMLCAYYYKGRSQKAIEAIEKALEVELPPVLLTPLYWLQKDRPDFFEQYARPLLEKYGL